MWPVLTLEDFKIIGHYLGYLIVLTGAIMVIPLVMAIASAQVAVTVNYLMSMGLCFFVGFMMCMLKINSVNLRRRQAVVITGLAWIVCSLLAAFPLWLSGHYAIYFDCMFEVMSGLTTTGFTMCQDIEHMAASDIMWRFIMHFVGGQGVVVIALSFGIFARSSSRATLYDAEGRHDHVMPEIRQTAVFIFQFSLFIVFAGGIVVAIILVSKGFDGLEAFFNGICVSIAAYDTAGFSTTSLGIGYYHSWPIEIVVMFIMVIGAVNFTLYSRLRKGKVKEFFHNFELRTFAIWMTIMTVFVIITMGLNGHMGDLDTLLRKGLFTVISAATSTGYQVITPEQMTDLLSSSAVSMVAITMIVGGMSDSMAGGIKAIRVGIMAKELVLRIKQVLLPDTARVVESYEHAGKKQLTQSLVSSALVVTMLYLVSVLIGSVIAMSMGYDPVPAFFESVSATANNGLTTGIVGPACPIVLKVVYFLQMWLGRLEFLSVLACIAAIITSIKVRGRRSRS